MKFLFQQKVVFLFLVLSLSITSEAQKNKKTIATLTQIEERWHHAFVTHDSTVLQEILAADFIILGRTGGRLGREGVFKNFRDDKSIYEYVTPYDMEFRIYKNCAIVMGKSKEKGVDDGKVMKQNIFGKIFLLKPRGNGIV